MMTTRGAKCLLWTSEETEEDCARRGRGGVGRRDGGRGEGGGGGKWDEEEKEKEVEARELDRARRMRKEERNCRSNVVSVRGVCLERRRLHQPSDRATRFSRSSHFYYRFRTVATLGACRFKYGRHS